METEAKSSPPFGPGFTDEQIKQAERMEIWASRVNDPCADFTEFRLLDNGGGVVAKKRIGGY